MWLIYLKVVQATVDQVRQYCTSCVVDRTGVDLMSLCIRVISMFYTLFSLFISAPSASCLLLRLLFFNKPQLSSQPFSNARSLNLSLADALAACRIFVAWEAESDKAWCIASANEVASVAWKPGHQLYSSSA